MRDFGEAYVQQDEGDSYGAGAAYSGTCRLTVVVPRDIVCGMTTNKQITVTILEPEPGVRCRNESQWGPCQNFATAGDGLCRWCRG